jgi:hypothetical protein
MVGTLVFFTRGKSAASAELTSGTPKMTLADAGSAIDPSTLAVPPIDSAAPSASASEVAARPKAARSADAPSAATASARPTAAPAARADDAPLSRDQKHRLESLQRMCDQGTFTPAECQAKRAEISHAQ